MTPETTEAIASLKASMKEQLHPTERPDDWIYVASPALRTLIAAVEGIEPRPIESLQEADGDILLFPKKGFNLLRRERVVNASRYLFDVGKYGARHTPQFYIPLSALPQPEVSQD